MSWSGNGSIYLKRERMNRVYERSESMTLPTLDEIFNSGETLEDEFANELVDQITFCRYPGSKRIGGSAIRAFLTADANVTILKRNGTIGALLNTLLNIDIKAECDSKHLSNTVQSLHILAKNDGIALQRLLANQHAIPLVLKLCRYTNEQNQSKSFDLLEWISEVENGIQELIKHGIMLFLFLPELLHSNRAPVRVKHGAVQMILRLTHLDAMTFLRHRFEEMMLDQYQQRMIDAYMEIHLLSATILHLNALQINKVDTLRGSHFTLLPHLIKKIIDESFEDLDHLVQIVKIATLISAYPHQIEFILKHDIMVALQYLVRTDFELLRRKDTSDPVSQVALINKKRRSKSVFADKRSLPTLMALASIKPAQTSSTRSDDINFSLSASAIEVYENIIDVKPETITLLVSSGLIPALLFRVGSGVDLDIRLNRLVVRFLTKMLFKVALGQPRYSWKISLSPQLIRVEKYARGPQKDHQKNSRLYDPTSKSPTGNVSSHDHVPDVNQRPGHDLRMISSTMRAQGVINLLLTSCKRTDEQQMVQQALFALSCFMFPCISEELYQPENMRRVCHLTRMKQDCFLSGLSLICDSINNPDISEKDLNEVLECNTIELLTGGLKMNGWTFNMKDIVFLAFSNLSKHPNFYEKLVNVPGAISALVYELNLHKKSDRPSRRKRIVEDIPDDGTDLLMMKLKPDWACTKIQSIVRARIGSKTVRARRLEVEAEAEAKRKEREEYEAKRKMKKGVGR